MRILFLAPQPFYQERGTPIAIRLALEVLTERLQELSGEPARIDLLTYHEGTSLPLRGVTHHRIRPPRLLAPLLRNIGAGISVKKLVCDVLFLGTVLRMLWRARADQYRIVHAVEESVFFALLAKLIFGIPYIYDMDSSLALQVTEKWWALRPLGSVLQWFERLAVKESIAVAPVCDALAQIAERHGSGYTRILRDISFLNLDAPPPLVTLRSELGLNADAKILLYVGNLETYQGIDLLLDGFAIAAPRLTNLVLIVIGGAAHHVECYRERVAALGLTAQAYFIGPRPLSELDSYLLQADFLVSPRTKGNNTPMKIYSYLHSGKPILATDLATHTQVLDRDTAMLFPPRSSDLSVALTTLLESPALQDRLGRRAREVAEERYTKHAFVRELEELYRAVRGRIDGGQQRFEEPLQEAAP